MCSRLQILLLATLLATCAAAQVPGSISSSPQAPRPATVQRPIVISGNVTTSAGEVPPEPAAIKRVCGSTIIPEGYTGNKGRFSFRVGGSARYSAMDASVDGAAPGIPQGDVSVFNTSRQEIGPGVDLSNCRLIAELPGFRSSSIQLGRRRYLDRPGVGTLVLTRLGDSTVALVSATSLAAPKAAQRALKKAIAELNKGPAAKLPRVVALLEQAISMYPSYAAAWTILGQTKRRMGDRDGAVQALERAMEADPSYMRPHEPLTTLLIELGQWQRAEDLSSRALRLDPTNVILRWFHAVSQFELNHPDGALADLDRIESDEEGQQYFPQTHHVRSMIYAKRGEFVPAAKELRRFLDLAPDSPLTGAVERQLAEWKALGLL